MKRSDAVLVAVSNSSQSISSSLSQLEEVGSWVLGELDVLLEPGVLDELGELHVLGVLPEPGVLGLGELV